MTIRLIGEGSVPMSASLDALTGAQIYVVTMVLCSFSAGTGCAVRSRDRDMHLWLQKRHTPVDNPFHTPQNQWGVHLSIPTIGTPWNSLWQMLHLQTDGYLRMTRGRCGSLGPHRMALTSKMSMMIR